MALIEIKHRFLGTVLFSLECGSLKIAVEAAVKDRADLAGAYLAGADLADAYLAGANLAGANLAGANLAGANLAGANLAGAYLAGANLAGANLAGANLAGAYLAGADLADADEVISAGQPNGFWAFGYRDKSGALRVKVGCRDKAIGDARAYWSNDDHPYREERREVLAALDYLEVVARLRGWTVAAPVVEAAQ